MICAYCARPSSPEHPVIKLHHIHGASLRCVTAIPFSSECTTCLKIITGLVLNPRPFPAGTKHSFSRLQPTLEKTEYFCRLEEITSRALSVDQVVGLIQGMPSRRNDLLRGALLRYITKEDTRSLERLLTTFERESIIFTLKPPRTGMSILYSVANTTQIKHPILILEFFALKKIDLFEGHSDKDKSLYARKIIRTTERSEEPLTDRQQGILGDLKAFVNKQDPLEKLKLSTGSTASLLTIPTIDDLRNPWPPTEPDDSNPLPWL